MQELRRGSDPAMIYSLALSKGCEWLAVSSDKGTVHVFALNDALRTGRETARHPNGTNTDCSTSSQVNPTSVLSVVKVSTLNMTHNSTDGASQAAAIRKSPVVLAVLLMMSTTTATI